MIGKVTFRISDVMALPPDVAADCDMTFTDPPWEPSALKMFETTMEKGGHGRPGNNIDAILQRLFALAPSDKPCFIEYSVKGHDRVIHWGKAAGHTFVRTVIGTQLSRVPYAILQFNSDMPDMGSPVAWGALEAALDYHQPKCVFEPFAGHAVHTSRMAKRGIRVIASEVNPDRAAKGLAALRKIGAL
jgi:hypothetical protein